MASTPSDAPINTDSEFFRKWTALMHGAGVGVRDVGNGNLEMAPEIEFLDEMTPLDREWVLQAPDEKVSWTISLEVKANVVSAPCLLAPTLQSKGWYELLSKRDLHLHLSPGDNVELWVYGSWRTTRNLPRIQSIARGRFTVPARGHSLGSPVFNVFLPGRMLLTLHMAFVEDSLRAIAASVRARLDECPFEDEE
jgi:hypothetical protein